MPLVATKANISSYGLGWGAPPSGGFGSYWIQLIGTAGNDIARGVTIYDDELYICGNLNGNGAVIKTDLDGNILWARDYYSVGGDAIAAIKADSSGNLYVAGYNNSPDWLVGKLNNDGTGVWWQYLDNYTTDHARALVLNSSEEPVVSGFLVHSSTQHDMAIAKWTTGGTLSYKSQARDFDTEYLNRSAIDASDNLLTAGYRSVSGYSYASIIIWDSTGIATVKQSISAGSFANSQFNSAAVDSAGAYYWVGSVQTFGGTQDLYLIKTNSSGTTIWQKTLVDTGVDIGQSIITDASNNVYVAGYTTSQGQGSNEIVIAKFDSSGTLLWQNILGGTGSDVAIGYLELDDYGGLIVVGYTGTSGSGGNDMIVCRLPTNGTGQGTYSLDGANYVYQTSTFTVGTPTHTWSPWSPTTNTATATNGGRNITENSVSPTQYITVVT